MGKAQTSLLGLIFAFSFLGHFHLGLGEFSISVAEAAPAKKSAGQKSAASKPAAKPAAPRASPKTSSRAASKVATKPKLNSNKKVSSTPGPAGKKPAVNKRIPTSLNAELGGGAFVGSGGTRALEVRGQARTLSMMLVLKNGKENVNFVKVRSNYKPEIENTDF